MLAESSSQENAEKKHVNSMHIYYGERGTKCLFLEVSLLGKEDVVSDLNRAKMGN